MSGRQMHCHRPPGGHKAHQAALDLPKVYETCAREAIQEAMVGIHLGHSSREYFRGVNKGMPTCTSTSVQEPDEGQCCGVSTRFGCMQRRR